MDQKYIDRFWSKVDIRDPDDCWPWKAGIGSSNCGQFFDGKKNFIASRFAYEITKGPLVNEACHTCDNRPCCNPNHLFDGTQNDNIQDAVRKDRMAKGENHGRAKLTENQVLQIRQEYIPRVVTLKQLARKYGVCFARISNIIRRKNWKHI